MDNTIQWCVAPCEALSFGTSMLKIHVGEGEHLKNFTVHELLLSQISEFVKRATGGSWQTGKQHFVCLPDDNSYVIGLYLNIVYAGQLATKGSEEWLQRCRLYVLAEKLQDRTSQNQIVDGMHTNLDETQKSCNVTQKISGQAIQELYEGTPNESKGRQLVVDFYAQCANEKLLHDERAHLTPDFFFDVAMGLLQRQKKEDENYRHRRFDFADKVKMVQERC